MKRARSKKSGFIAIITAIVLSLTLLGVTVALNQQGFFMQSTILNNEFKEHSNFLASSCIHVALLRLAQNSTYAGNEIINLETATCTIRPIVNGIPSSDETTLESSAHVGASVTNLRVIIDASDFSVRSWDELSTF